MGKDVFGVLPRVLAAVGSGVGAVVIVGGAVYSAVRFARDRNAPGHARLAGANTLIALGTLVLSSGGLVQGAVGHDEAFTADASRSGSPSSTRASCCATVGTRPGRSRPLRVKSHPEWSLWLKPARATADLVNASVPRGSSNGSGTRVQAA